MDPQRQSPPHCSSQPCSPMSPCCEALGYVGIDAVLDQLKIKAMKMGFEFHIMVVERPGQVHNGEHVVQVQAVEVYHARPGGARIPDAEAAVSDPRSALPTVIEEKGVKLKLTVTDTPGFGDQINNDKCWNPILGYINEQYERYLQEETLIARQRHIPDTRVHCCVYFVPPTGHCLRPLDIGFLRRLCRTVNVVPVIARADSLTLEEREIFRHKVVRAPAKRFDDDINDRLLNSKIRERIPFAVVGADQEHMVNGRCVLGRKTKWGVIEVENMEHCEFLLLRNLLIRSHLQDLKDVTHNIYYENYRVCRLNQSHTLPRGPGWVALAPAPTCAPATPRRSKARLQVRDKRDKEH
ncbi:septin-12 isoform X3 [Manis javanica]|uniref:septin-12 isoform X3 n=1 Tax=Manis javanica TaxID=9974 RepID=UPI003C6D3E75